ncbi:MAG: hypothetical protein WDM81_16990 [Rhizomicrobium sp.]
MISAIASPSAVCAVMAMAYPSLAMREGCAAIVAKTAIWIRGLVNE